MIPINEIRAWSNVVHRVNDEQIEQDLVICRSLVEINCREHFTVLGYKDVAFSIDTKWYKL
jgi:hypothetical protein